MRKTWIDNNRILEIGSKASGSISEAFASSPHYFASGREALFALLAAETFTDLTSTPSVLLPAFLPEGLYLPFKKKNWTILFYNLDQNGNPIWEEVQEKTSVKCAVLIHLFGIRRDAKKFQSLLPSSAILLEDFAHNTPYSTDRISTVGDVLLFSPTKILGLPDGGFYF